MPDYAILIIVLTTMFVAASSSVLVTYGLTLSTAERTQKQRFAVWMITIAIVWVALAAALAYSGLLVPTATQAFPILGFLVIGPAILGSLVLIRSKTATSVLQSIPAHWLATVQVYRIVGVLFLLLASDGYLSAYFANSTGWGDIFVGVTAPVVGYLLWRDSKKFAGIAAVWCIVGIGDLLLVLFKALRTAPGPLQAPGVEIETVIVGQFPFPFIPLLIVPISLILHVQLLRRLFIT